MPLTLVESGVEHSIKRISGKDNTRRFLEELGFVAGERVTVIADASGDMIVNVKNARIAIGKSMACRVIV